MKTLTELITTVLKSKTNHLVIDGKEYVPNKAYEMYLKQIALEVMEISTRDTITGDELVKLARDILKNIE